MPIEDTWAGAHGLTPSYQAPRCPVRPVPRDLSTVHSAMEVTALHFSRHPKGWTLYIAPAVLLAIVWLLGSLLGHLVK